MRLHYAKLGAGKPVMVLHGLFGSNDNWRSVVSELASDYEVWALDLRNHGKSNHSPEMDLPDMAEDVAALIGSHGLRDVRLIGHSLGGKVGMQLALTRPEVVTGLIVVDIAPREYEPRHVTILSALQSFDPAGFQDRRKIEELLAPEIPDLSVRRFLLKSLVRDESGRFSWQLNLRAIAENYSRLNAAPGAGGRYDGPALFVKGELSDYILDTDMPRILQLFPSARLCTVPGADHWVHATAPGAFLKCVQEFLRESAG